MASNINLIVSKPNNKKNLYFDDKLNAPLYGENLWAT